MHELALFAGAGGGILGGVLLGRRTVCAVELDPYCREILLRRQEEGHLPPFPVWDDIRTFDGKPWRGTVDVVTAGFPCQPWSVAGRRKGEDDKRNLWPDTCRVLREVGPRWALLENVPHLVSHDYFGRVLGDLGEMGFDAEWGVISARAAGANHRRDRLWIVANANSQGLEGKGEVLQPAECNWWSAEPDVCRVDAGTPYRVDRLRALGNGQVPAVVRAAWERMAHNGGDVGE